MRLSFVSITTVLEENPVASSKLVAAVSVPPRVTINALILF